MPLAKDVVVQVGTRQMGGLLRAATAFGTAAAISFGVCSAPAGAAVTSGTDVEAIKQVKENYFAAVDLNNWPALYRLLTPRAVVDTTDDGGSVFPNRDAFVAFDALLLSAISTHHEGYNPQITVADDGLTATGTWQMNGRLADPFNLITIHGHGVYTESYVKIDGHWLIDKSKLVHHYQALEILPGILNITIPIRDDGTGYPVSTPEAGADPNPDVEAIKQLKMNYFAAVDLNNWPALRRLFTQNAVVDTSAASGPVFPNRDAFVAFDAVLLTALGTHHEGYNPQITVADDGVTATGTWQMNDRLADPFNLITIHGHGVYTDSYVKVDGQWLVDKSKLDYHSQALELLPGILNIAIPLRNDGTPFPPAAATSASWRLGKFIGHRPDADRQRETVDSAAPTTSSTQTPSGTSGRVRRSSSALQSDSPTASSDARSRTGSTNRRTSANRAELGHNRRSKLDDRLVSSHDPKSAERDSKA